MLILHIDQAIGVILLLIQSVYYCDISGMGNVTFGV